MPDPHILYAVLAVVVTGLVCWVIAVNIWAPKRLPAPPSPDAQSPDKSATGSASRTPGAL